ncbi:MAG TPA: hypothetical protein VFM64_04975 [Candidatus Nitrosotenuis sp.]|nr:hypothetical protein [Candidatus Nitrosotenuis sp.]
MPLSKDALLKLQEMSEKIPDKNRLSNDDESLIKNTFSELLEKGHSYDVEDIESWLDYDESWSNKATKIRITNMSHYVQQRYWQKPKKLHMVSDESCGCD